MFMTLNLTSIRTGLFLVGAMALTSCTSTQLASQNNLTSADSYALVSNSSIAKINTDWKTQQAARLAEQKKQAAIAKQKNAKVLNKKKLAAAKQSADRDAKRLADFDKMLAPMGKAQKKLFKSRRDQLAAQAAKSRAAFQKLQGRYAPKIAGAKGSRYNSLIAKHARANGVPIKLAHAVIRIESAYRANARGGAGEIGLMQIKPSTARMMGYRGSARGLYNPETNLKYGMKYLGKAHRLAKGNTCGTILRYNAGHGATRMNPVSSRYCKRVRNYI